jgi:hypothetical protein
VLVLVLVRIGPVTFLPHQYMWLFCTWAELLHRQVLSENPQANPWETVDLRTPGGLDVLLFCWGSCWFPAVWHQCLQYVQWLCCCWFWQEI